MDVSPPSDLVDRAEAILGRRVRRALPVRGGYTPAARFVLDLGGDEVFAKMATSPLTAGWLRAEHRMYEVLDAPFAPSMRGWADDPDRPLLLLESLRGADWPPPWDGERVLRVRETLRRVAATRPPDWLPVLETYRDELAGWRTVAEDPAPFLGLGLVSVGWLDTSLPVLLLAEGTAPLDGNDLVHFDVRSDNLCFLGDRTVLVDWNGCARGDGTFDLAAWLPSLHAEGGPPPWELMPDSEGRSALLAGYWAARAGLPPPEGAPRVREVQLACLRVALPWAALELGLPPPDGR